jgi:hypothetical protein
MKSKLNPNEIHKYRWQAHLFLQNLGLSVADARVVMRAPGPEEVRRLRAHGMREFDSCQRLDSPAWKRLYRKMDNFAKKMARR